MIHKGILGASIYHCNWWPSSDMRPMNSAYEYTCMHMHVCKQKIIGLLHSAHIAQSLRTHNLLYYSSKSTHHVSYAMRCARAKHDVCLGVAPSCRDQFDTSFHLQEPSRVRLFAPLSFAQCSFQERLPMGMNVPGRVIEKAGLCSVWPLVLGHHRRQRDAAMAHTWR